MLYRYRLFLEDGTEAGEAQLRGEDQAGGGDPDRRRAQAARVRAG
jgi:hypothetical protein